MPFRRGRLIAWIAASAVLLQALWPLLSHARPADPSLVVPVCTIDGVTHFLEIKTGKKTPLDERSATHGEHCKLCVFGTDKLALPDAVPGFVASAGTSESASGDEAVSIQYSAVSAAHPRAPPVLN